MMRKITQTFKYGFPLAALSLLSGCMMMGMHQMNGMNHDMQNQKVIVKEVIKDDIKISAEFPEYILGHEVPYTVTVTSEKDSMPISNADLIMSVDLLSDTKDQDSADYAKTAFTLKPEEIIKEDGKYIFYPKFETGGSGRIEIKMKPVDESNNNSQIVLQQTISIASGNGHQENWLNRYSTVLMYAGAAAMVVMMALRFY